VSDNTALGTPPARSVSSVFATNSDDDQSDASPVMPPVPATKLGAFVGPTRGQRRVGTSPFGGKHIDEVEERRIYNTDLKQFEGDPVMWQRMVRGRASEWLKPSNKITVERNKTLNGIDALEQYPCTYEGYRQYLAYTLQEKAVLKELAEDYAGQHPTFIDDGSRATPHSGIVWKGTAPRSEIIDEIRDWLRDHYRVISSDVTIFIKRAEIISKSNMPILPQIATIAFLAEQKVYGKTADDQKHWAASLIAGTAFWTRVFEHGTARGAGIRTCVINVNKAISAVSIYKTKLTSDEVFVLYCALIDEEYPMSNQQILIPPATKLPVIATQPFGVPTLGKTAEQIAAEADAARARIEASKAKAEAAAIDTSVLNDAFPRTADGQPADDAPFTAVAKPVVPAVETTEKDTYNGHTIDPVEAVFAIPSHVQRELKLAKNEVGKVVLGILKMPVGEYIKANGVIAAWKAVEAYEADVYKKQQEEIALQNQAMLLAENSPQSIIEVGSGTPNSDTGTSTPKMQIGASTGVFAQPLIQPDHPIVIHHDNSTESPVTIYPSEHGEVVFDGHRYSVTIRAHGTAAQAIATLQEWQKFWQMGATLGISHITDQRQTQPAAYIPPQQPVPAPQVPPYQQQAAAYPQPVPQTQPAYAPPQQPGGGTSGVERCVLIEVGTGYTSGNLQLQFKCVGKEYPLRYSKKPTEMVKLLANIRRPDGMPITIADLFAGNMFPGNWNVNWTKKADSQYENVMMVVPA
jgi:hypothetical protein